jgi:hypothetical protein
MGGLKATGKLRPVANVPRTHRYFIIFPQPIEPGSIKSDVDHGVLGTTIVRFRFEPSIICRSA